MGTGTDMGRTGHSQVQRRNEESGSTQSGSARRILFVSKTAQSTGPTTSLRLLLTHLSGGHHVEVLVQGAGPFCAALGEMGIPYRSFPSMGRADIPSLIRFLGRERYDLVYTNEVSRASRNACIAATLTGTPFMSHVRSMGWDHGWTRLGHLKLARGVIAVSDACGASVRRFVPPGRLHIVHNGVSPEAFREPSEGERSDVRAELGVGADTSLALIVSHVTQRKGQLLGIQAMERVLSAVPDVHLALVGALDREPDYVERLRRAIKEPPLQGHVSILGFRPDVPRLLRGADLLVHTAVADPHPRAVLEGMAAALPVVAFATDGVSETVEDGVTGWLVPSGNVDALAGRLRKVLAMDGSVRRSVGMAGRTRVRDLFTESRAAAKVTEIMERTLEEKPPRRG